MLTSTSEALEDRWRMSVLSRTAFSVSACMVSVCSLRDSLSGVDESWFGGGVVDVNGVGVRAAAGRGLVGDAAAGDED